jgi:hypothetical protein
MSTASGSVAPAARLSEDVVALGLGLLIFVLGLGSFFGGDLLGWVVTTSVWTAAGSALAPVSKGFASLGGPGALLATFAALLVVLSVGASALGLNARRLLDRRQLRSHCRGDAVGL